MALIFHDGFESGGADAWESVTGTPAFHADYANTGNYGMGCDASGEYAQKSFVPPPNRITFRFIYGGDCSVQAQIFDASTKSVEIRINTDQTLYLTDGLSNDSGSTVLQADTPYRISLSRDGNNIKLYLGENEECSITSIDDLSGTLSLGWINGTFGSDCYFDDFAADNTSSTDCMADIRTLAARPVSIGDDEDTGDTKWQERISGNNLGVTFTHPEYLANDPPSTTSGAWEEADGNAHYLSLDLDDCGSGNLSDIGGSDTIHAVNFLFYYATEAGGSAGEYNMYGRDTSGRSSMEILDDPKDPTWVAQYQTTSWDGDGNPWTQAEFNDQQMGMMCQDANKDIEWYEAYAMVAYEPAVGGTLYLTGTSDAVSSVSGDISEENSLTGSCSVTSGASGAIGYFYSLTGTYSVQSTAAGAISETDDLSGTCSIQSAATGIVLETGGLVGTCDTQSSTAAAINQVATLAGIADGQSSVLSDILYTLSLSGTCVIQSAITGAIYELDGLIGTCDSQLTCAGNISETDDLNGVSGSQSSASGSVGYSYSLFGTSGGQSTAGAVILESAILSGVCDGQSTVSGAIKYICNLTGTCETQSSVSGELSVGGEVLYLTGTCDSQSSVIAAITLSATLTGICDSQSSVSGGLDEICVLTGVCSGQSASSGDVVLDYNLIGVCEVQSTVEGQTKVAGLLTGSIPAQSSLAAQITLNALIAGTSVGQSYAAADLSTSEVSEYFLSGGVSCQSSAIASISSYSQYVYTTSIKAKLTYPLTAGQVLKFNGGYWTNESL